MKSISMNRKSWFKLIKYLDKETKSSEGQETLLTNEEKFDQIADLLDAARILYKHECDRQENGKYILNIAERTNSSASPSKFIANMVNNGVELDDYEVPESHTEDYLGETQEIKECVFSIKDNSHIKIRYFINYTQNDRLSKKLIANTVQGNYDEITDNNYTSLAETVKNLDDAIMKLDKLRKKIGISSWKNF